MGHFESVVPLDTVFAIARPQNHVKIFAQQKGARNGEVSGEPLKPGRFPAFVCVRRPVVAILGPRYSLGMDDLDNSVISRGGVGVYWASQGDPKLKSRLNAALAICGPVSRPIISPVGVA